MTLLGAASVDDGGTIGSRGRYCAMHNFERDSVTVDGLKVAYRDLGKGSPVVYIHGALTTLDEGVIGLGDALTPRRRLLAFDRAGHGHSDRDGATGSAWRQAALIHGGVKALGVERPVVVGHSFGGAVAMAYALQFPDELTGVVALAPIAFPEPRFEQILFGMRATPGMGDWLSLMAGPSDGVMLPILWNGMFLPQAMTPAFKAGFPFGIAGGRQQIKADGEDAALMVMSLTRNALLYGQCRVPVHVIQGDSDMVVNPLTHGRPLAAMTPRGTFTSLSGLGHMAHHFAPDAVGAAIDALIENDGSVKAPPSKVATASRRSALIAA